MGCESQEWLNRMTFLIVHLAGCLKICYKGYLIPRATFFFFLIHWGTQEFRNSWDVQRQSNQGVANSQRQAYKRGLGNGCNYLKDQFQKMNSIPGIERESYQRQGIVTENQPDSQNKDWRDHGQEKWCHPKEPEPAGGCEPRDTATGGNNITIW